MPELQKMQERLYMTQLKSSYIPEKNGGYNKLNELEIINLRKQSNKTRRTPIIKGKK